MYMAPAENTAKYTMMKATRDEPTAGAARGDADSTVRSSPYTVNGCRPVSVVIQPARTAMKPAGAIAIAKTCNNRDSYSVPRQRVHRPNKPSANISTPIPTMIRNDQNVIGTGGQFSRGTVSSPASGASGECLRISEPSLGISMAYLTLPAAWSGKPNNINGAPSLWLSK